MQELLVAAILIFLLYVIMVGCSLKMASPIMPPHITTTATGMEPSPPQRPIYFPRPIYPFPRTFSENNLRSFSPQYRDPIKH